jgi:hypothetical protein
MSNQIYDQYKCNANDTARFILGRERNRNLIIVGLNPSTATKEKSDPTVARVETVSANNQYDGFIMTNLYPLRSTDPKGLPEKCDADLFRTNVQEIISVAEKESDPVIWAAWGGDIVLRPYLADALTELVKGVDSLNGEWLHYGDLRVDGHPRHPSRISYSWAFNSFDIHRYVESLTSA